MKASHAEAQRRKESTCHQNIFAVSAPLRENNSLMD